MAQCLARSTPTQVQGAPHLYGEAGARRERRYGGGVAAILIAMSFALLGEPTIDVAIDLAVAMLPQTP